MKPLPGRKEVEQLVENEKSAMESAFRTTELSADMIRTWLDKTGGATREDNNRSLAGTWWARFRRRA